MNVSIYICVGTANFTEALNQDRIPLKLQEMDYKIDNYMNPKCRTSLDSHFPYNLYGELSNKYRTIEGTVVV